MNIVNSLAPLSLRLHSCVDEQLQPSLYMALVITFLLEVKRTLDVTSSAPCYVN